MAAPSRAETCALCKDNTQLVESHVLPAFVFRWLKETSATGFIRMAENPKRRAQDGLKFPWLCASCEKLLNEFETPFATKVFHRYNANEASKVFYQKWMLKFCASVSWRVLRHVWDETGLANFSEEQRREAGRALEQWRAFIFGEVHDVGPYEQHLLPIGGIENTTVTDLPDVMNRYLMRAVEMDMPSGEKSAFSFAKMGRFLLFGFIVPSERKWRGTKVATRAGTIQPSRYVLPVELLEYLKDRANRYRALIDAIPEHQKDKIEAAVVRDPTRMRASDTLKAMLRDEEMFGTGAVLRRSRPYKTR